MTSVKWLDADHGGRPAVRRVSAGAARTTSGGTRTIPATPLTRIFPARADGPARASPGFPERTRTVDAGPTTIEGRAWSGWARVDDASRSPPTAGRPGPRLRSSPRGTAGPGAAGAPNGTRRRASTSSPAAPATRPGTSSPTTEHGTSAATPTTASSASRSPSSSRGRTRSRASAKRSVSYAISTTSTAASTPSEASAGRRVPAGIRARTTTAATSRCRFSDPTFRSRNAMWREQVQRRRRREGRPRARAPERRRRAAIVVFRPSATRTIPATIQKWRYEYESRAISFCSRPGGSLRQMARRRRGRRRRSRATTTRRRPPPRGTPPTTTPASTTLPGAEADRDDRLAEGDDDDQLVALGEVARLEPPAVGAEEERPAEVEDDRGDPERSLHLAVERGRERRSARRRPRSWRRAPATERSSAGSPRPASANRTMLPRPHDRVRDGEEQRRPVEGRRARRAPRRAAPPSRRRSRAGRPLPPG